MAHYLVTGAAGFIGYHLSKALLDRGNEVLGVDNLNAYYSVTLKRDRLDQLTASANFRFEKLDLADRHATESLFQRRTYDTVLHMAAQVGVRYSIENPHVYVDSNVRGFVNVLEGCRTSRVKHLVYASSSSVYGANEKLPFSVSDPVEQPISLYGATKRANELMAYTYSHLYHLPTTGLRFFTVYGPWGRPDMALYKFADAISSGRPIDVNNSGRMRRDFTYIDDAVEAVLRVAQRIPEATAYAGALPALSHTGSAPYRLYNVGNHDPVELESLISLLERCLGRKAKRNYLPLQPGDMMETYASTDALQAAVGFCPCTPIDVGVTRFVEWYRQYHS